MSTNKKREIQGFRLSAEPWDRPVKLADIRVPPPNSLIYWMECFLANGVRVGAMSDLWPLVQLSSDLNSQPELISSARIRVPCSVQKAWYEQTLQTDLIRAISSSFDLIELQEGRGTVKVVRERLEAAANSNGEFRHEVAKPIPLRRGGPRVVFEATIRPTVATLEIKLRDKNEDSDNQLVESWQFDVHVWMTRFAGRLKPRIVQDDNGSSCINVGHHYFGLVHISN